jgi:asparaginyl-tRNA synthetase
MATYLPALREMNLPERELWWYLDLRKFGSAPHSGFGLGFERLMLFVTLA